MAHLDASMSDMENGLFLKQFGWMVRHFMDDLNFTSNETLCMLLIYYKFTEANTKKSKQKLMRREQLVILFEALFGFQDTRLVSRIVVVISDNTSFVTPEAWMYLISIFMCNNLYERMKFAFSVYDMRGTGGLNTELISNAVECFFTGDDEDLMSELRIDMVELIFKKFDTDRDGIIDFREYSGVVQDQPCLLEFLGQCFPGRERMSTIAMCLNFDSHLSSDRIRVRPLHGKTNKSKKKYDGLSDSSKIYK